MGHIEAELHGRGDLIDILPARAGGADELLMNFFLIDHNRAGNSNHASSVRRVGFSGKRRFYPGQERILTGHLILILHMKLRRDPSVRHQGACQGLGRDPC